MQTRERSWSCRPHKPYTYTNCRPFKLCLKIHVFSIQRVDYEQKDGAAMGSPVSAVIANLYMEEFEERAIAAIATATYKRKIWKRYVDDTFTVLVDGFLQHLNSQQPTIRFTMKIEKDNTIRFLDTSVSRDSNGLLTTTVYRKPTHTDQYLAYDSHHPQSVKRGIVKCLFDRAKHLTSKPSAISEEKKHLSSVLVSNGYPSSFVRKLTKTTKPIANKEPTQKFKSTLVLPYIKGVSEVLRRCLQQQGIRTVLKSDTTLRSHLVRPKDALEPTKRDGVVYKIPCECGKVYIGETGRAMQDRIKEHDRDIRLARTQNSAVSEHANETRYLPIGKEVKFIDRDPQWYTRRVILITSIEIVESKFLKLGCLRSKSTTADQPQSGPVREQHLIVGIIMRMETHQ